MPELPDVELRKKYINKHLAGDIIHDAKILDSYIVRGQNRATVESGVEGKKVLGAKRRGKYILVELSGESALLIHFGMTGDIVVQDYQKEEPHFTRAVFFLDSQTFYYKDQRKFGKIHYYPTSDLKDIPEIKKLGPEPLDPDFDFDWFKEVLKSHDIAIHKVLMIQEEIAGIGNVYSDEICYRAGVKPDKLTSSLKESEILNLYKGMKDVLTKAVKLDADLSSQPDNFISAHRNTDRLCPGSSTPLKHKMIGGRTSYWCPERQK
jgi:formamidopyrimidine-DNA glycosylase